MGGIGLMATFFTVLFTAVGKAAAGVGGASAAAGAASSGLSLSSVFSIGSTIVGGLASIAAGNQQAAAMEAQADQDDIQATQDELAGRQEAVNAIRRMNEEMGAGVVAGYASGLQGSGSTQVALDEAQRSAERNADLTRSNAQMSAAARRASGVQRREDAKGARSSGIFGAIAGGMQSVSRTLQRG